MCSQKCILQQLTYKHILRHAQCDRAVSPDDEDGVDVDRLEEHPDEGRSEEEVDRHGDRAAVRLVAALQGKVLPSFGKRAFIQRWAKRRPQVA